MSLALATRGYLCRPAAQIPGGTIIGKGPTIVDAKELKPKIDHGRQLSPKIVRGQEEDD